ATQVNVDYRLRDGSLADGATSFQLKQLGQGQAAQAQSAELQEIAPREAVAEARGVCTGEGEHRLVPFAAGWQRHTGRRDFVPRSSRSRSGRRPPMSSNLDTLVEL